MSAPALTAFLTASKLPDLHAANKYNVFADCKGFVNDSFNAMGSSFLFYYENISYFTINGTYIQGILFYLVVC